MLLVSKDENYNMLNNNKNTYNNNETGNLVFGHRKIAFFDLITAQEREKARAWIKKETESAKKRDREMLDGYLMNIQKGKEEDLTLTVAAALILGSISITSLESLEGMHK